MLNVIFFIVTLACRRERHLRMYVCHDDGLNRWMNSPASSWINGSIHDEQGISSE